MSFDTSEETVILQCVDGGGALVRWGDTIFQIKDSDVPDDASIGDRFDYFNEFNHICTDCSKEKLYDEKNQVYYCPKCE
jgi:hypothetical protein